MFNTIRLSTSDSNACTPVAIAIEWKEVEGAEVEVIFLEEAKFKAERRVIIEHPFAGKEYGYSEEIGLQQARAKAKLNAFYPKLNVDEFRTTPDELEIELSNLDNKHGIYRYIRDGRLNFVCHDANDFAEKTQRFGASAELENGDAVVL